MAERRITGPVNDPGRGTSQATQAAIEAETNEDTYLPPDLLKHSPGVAKFWVMHDDAGTINASYNVASITDTGTGDHTVNISTDMSSVTYCVLAVSGSTGYTSQGSDVPAAGSVRIQTRDSLGVLADLTRYYVAGLGDQ